MVALAFISIGTIVAWYFSIATLGHAYFAYQAQGFLQGSLFYPSVVPNLVDSSVTSAGLSYWGQPPLPAFILLPLVIFLPAEVAQTLAHAVVPVAAVTFCFILARRRGYGFSDSWWLALAFTFASVFLGPVALAHAWQFSSAVGASFGLWFMWEFTGKRRPSVLGALAAAALATRPPVALMASVLYALVTLFEVQPVERFTKLAKFITPLILAGLLLVGLNYVRTGSAFDTGYRSAQINSEIVALRQNYGLFSWRNIPTNIYHMFLAPLTPVTDGASLHLKPPFVVGNWAMGFFLLSPIFLQLLFVPLATRYQQALAWACAIGLVCVLSFYAVNINEFGPRYLVDVLPFAFMLLLEAFPNNKLWLRHKLVIGASTVFNFYLLVSLSWSLTR